MDGRAFWPPLIPWEAAEGTEKKREIKNANLARLPRGKNPPDNLRRCLWEQFVLDSMNPVLEHLQRVPLAALDLARRDRRPAVHLGDHVVHHDAGPVALQFSVDKVLVCPLDGRGAVVHAWKTAAR